MVRLPVERWGLGTRITVLSLLALLLVLGSGGWLLRQQLHQTVLRGFEADLRVRAERLQWELEAYGPFATSGMSPQQGEFARIFSGWYWVLRDGTEAQQSRSAWDSTLDLGSARPWPGRNDLLHLQGPQQQNLLGLRHDFSLHGQAVELHVFGPLDPTQAEWQRIDRVLGLTLGVGWLVILVLTLAQVRLGLAPLRQLQARLRAVESGQAQRVGTGFGPDLNPMAHAMDQVLQHNAQVVERARHQAADLSHALKKPLAVLGIQARGDTVSGPWLQEQVQAMSHSIDRHLARFASGAGTHEQVALAPLLERLLPLIRQIHGERGLQWTTHVEPDLRWRGAPPDMEEMAGNLLDNAGKWALTRVRLRVERDGAWLFVCVEDDGPGMGDDVVARTPARGRRFDEQTAGHGLGLAIVQDIAATYGGHLRLDRSPIGGLLAELKLPVA